MYDELNCSLSLLGKNELILLVKKQKQYLVFEDFGYCVAWDLYYFMSKWNWFCL